MRQLFGANTRAAYLIGAKEFGGVRSHVLHGCTAIMFGCSARSDAAMHRRVLLGFRSFYISEIPQESASPKLTAVFRHLINGFILQAKLSRSFLITLL